MDRSYRIKVTKVVEENVGVQKEETIRYKSKSDLWWLLNAFHRSWGWTPKRAVLRRYVRI